MQINSIEEATSIWRDVPEVHRGINDSFTQAVNNTPKLKAYRDWIESNIFGFGERSFLWMWKLLLDEVPEPKFLEIGVFRGQIIGLVRMLSPEAEITGITPLNSTGGHWESDYKADIKHLHDIFTLKQPEIIEGLSTDQNVMDQVKDNLYDIVYIDGGHDKPTASHDIKFYSQLVKPGGYLVIDDCCNKYNLPDGYFRGIQPVSEAVDEVLPNEQFRELFSVVHNRIFQRV